MCKLATCLSSSTLAVPSGAALVLQPTALLPKDALLSYTTSASGQLPAHCVVLCLTCRPCVSPSCTLRCLCCTYSCQQEKAATASCFCRFAWVRASTTRCRFCLPAYHSQNLNALACDMTASKSNACLIHTQHVDHTLKSPSRSANLGHFASVRAPHQHEVRGPSAGAYSGVTYPCAAAEQQPTPELQTIAT